MSSFVKTDKAYLVLFLGGVRACRFINRFIRLQPDLTVNNQYMAMKTV